MSKANRHHMFFWIEMDQAEQKNTHTADIIYVIQGSVKQFVFFLSPFSLSTLRE